MRREHLETGVQGEEESVAPWEVAIQQSDTYARFFGDIPKRCGVIAARGDQLQGRGI
jgi:hypothetical protein